MTEELDNSLRQAIESYLNERLLAIDEQLSRLQTEFDEAFTRVRESSATKPIDETPLANAINAHLQAAREQKLSGVTANAQSAREVGVIKRSVAEIEQQQTHSDVLRVLLMSAVQFAERAALFVIRNEQASGWQVCEARDATNLETIRNVTVPLNADTLLGQVARSREAWTGAPGANADDQRLIEQLGGSPQSLAAVPLIARGKVVAILYADTASADSGAINLDALELLTRVAGMAVNLAAAPAVPHPQASQPAATESVSTAAVTPETISEAEPGYVPQIEPQTAEAPTEPVVKQAVTQSEVADAQPESPIEAAAAEPAVEEAADQSEAPTRALPEVHSVFAQESRVEASSTTEAPVEAAPAEAEPAAPPVPPAPDFSAQYATPLGTARRYGVTEPDLPIEVGEEERRLHNDARRFARLLVSEIKLYNEQKVKEGRNDGNIYDRLREDIDRSRQMYDKRVAPPVAARHDYFHQELVNTLAEGDPARLGVGYPGASVAAG